MLSPQEPREEQRRPGVGFFVLLALLTVIALIMVYAFAR